MLFTHWWRDKSWIHTSSKGIKPVVYYVFTQPLYMSRMWQVIFKGSGFKFSSSSTGCQTKVKESSVSYYLPIAEGRIDAYLSQGY